MGKEIQFAIGRSGNLNREIAVIRLSKNTWKIAKKPRFLLKIQENVRVQAIAITNRKRTS